MAARMTIQGLDELERKLDKITVESRNNIVQALDVAGLMVLRSAQQKCPVDTGNLRASLTKEVSDRELYAVVGTKVHYAPYVEYGTRRMRPKPYLKPAFYENEKDIRQKLSQAVLKAIKEVAGS